MVSLEMLLSSPLRTSKCSLLAWGSSPQAAACDSLQPLSVIAPLPGRKLCWAGSLYDDPGQLPSVRSLGVSLKPTLGRHI